MKARFRKEKDIFFIDIEGALSLRGVDSLRAFCDQNLTKKRIIFNLKSMFFVGSAGISVFSKTLENLGKRNDLKVCCVSPEFQKIFQSEGLDFIAYQSEKEAVSSFFNPLNPLNQEQEQEEEKSLRERLRSAGPAVSARPFHSK